MKQLKYWIKERHNPQLGTYYVACGRLTIRESKKHERTLYGDNVMHSFDSVKAYKDKLTKLRVAGEKVQGFDAKKKPAK